MNANDTNTMVDCGDCNASGGTDRPCPACHGRGVRRALVLCEACGEYEATRDGLCSICDDDVREFLGGGTVESFDVYAARFYYGDDEGELLARGLKS